MTAMMTTLTTHLVRLVLLVLAAAALLVPAAARADDVAAASRGVVRVVTVAIVGGEVVGFGHGSGFAVSPTRIVTNAHVVESAVRYPNNVALGVVPSEGEKSYEARLVALDTEHDLALLEIVEGRVPPTALYTGPVEAGLNVIALGYPGNVDAATAVDANDYITPRSPVRSEGNFSNLQRIAGVTAMVHTASIARGNSGGPLVDECGRVIGVNTFLTRADDGDASFGFAIAGRELARFLTQAGQRFTAVATSCLSLSDADARDRAALSAEERAAARAAQARAERLAERRAAALDAARADAQRTRENFLAGALALFVFGALALGGAGLLSSKGKPREAKRALIGGGVLMLLAVAVFLLRPSPQSVTVPLVTDDAAEATPAVAAAEGPMLCTIVPERSRITVSPTDDVPLDVAATGCVNRRTQYARTNDGRFTRILVPNDDATVSVLSFDPATATYRNERYLLGAADIAEARRLRAAVTLKQCGADDGAVDALAAQQDAILSALPAAPNERLVYRCAKAP